MFKTKKMVYEHPDVEILDNLDLCVLCQSTTEGYTPVTDEEFTGGWTEN